MTKAKPIYGKRHVARTDVTLSCELGRDLTIRQTQGVMVVLYDPRELKTHDSVLSLQVME